MEHSSNKDFAGLCRQNQVRMQCYLFREKTPWAVAATFTTSGCWPETACDECDCPLRSSKWAAMYDGREGQMSLLCGDLYPITFKR
jgi:hypothetical protein